MTRINGKGRLMPFKRGPENCLKCIGSGLR
jgi:hypothetical protein